MLLHNQSPSYLFQLVPSPNTRYFERNLEKIPQLRIKHEFFKNFVFLFTIKEGNSLAPEIRQSKSISIFKNNVLNIILPKPNYVYYWYCHNPKGIRPITRLRTRRVETFSRSRI